MENFVKLFVYGTLKEGYGNNRYYLYDCEKLGEGWLKGFEMRASGIPFVYYSNDPESKVYGDIYRVPWDKIVNSIDFLEGHPSFYTRTWIEDQLGGVWVYLCDYSRTPIVESGIYEGWQ